MKTYQQLTDVEKQTIREEVDELIQNLSLQLSAEKSAVADTAFYRLQKHAEWGRNASKKQKDESFAAHQGKCERCGDDVAREKAIFHHKQRGVANQHGPQNLVPHHNSCHDSQHGAVENSLTKGTRE